MKLTKLKVYIPELFLMISVLYYWSLTSNILNPIAISLFVVIVFQIISKKPISGLLISGVFIILNLFLVLALLSELSEFETVNDDYNNLLIFGSLYLGINLIVGTVMFSKYLKQQIN